MADTKRDDFLASYKAWNDGRKEWHELAERMWKGEDVKDALRAKTTELDTLHKSFVKLGEPFVHWK